jgi:NAD(P)-dependent dehydrogenase (short-subunit alcohol dehydrogenase family)
MSLSGVFSSGKVAVITGGADGIGLACAQKLLGLGLQVCISDNNEEKLQQVSEQLPDVMTVSADVSQMTDIERLRDTVYARFGRVNVLMNNAGTGRRGNSAWTGYEGWLQTLNVNLVGVINGIHTFVPAMLEQDDDGVVINTGSKQGITLPPGNPAYNVSKAGVKAVTEMLQYEFRNTEKCRLSAHLLVPGFTYSGMIRPFLPDKPPGAWTTEQVADFMVDHVSSGDFYIICPDNDTSRSTDNRRMAWAMGDLINNRPALSRWHPEHESTFESYMHDHSPDDGEPSGDCS